MREALTSRHMGRVIRSYRCHPFHGRRPLPQGVVARWLGMTQGQLSRIENGPPVVHLDRLAHWALLLGIPPGDLWFGLPCDQPGPSDAGLALASPAPLPAARDGVDTSQWWAPTGTAEMAVGFTGKDVALERRAAARALAGVVAGSALLEPLERWLSRGSERRPVGRPAGVGYQEVEQIERAAQVFRTWDDQFGGGLRRKAVIGQLNEVAELLGDSHPSEIRRRLFGALGQLAETAAIMSWDSGQQGLAQRYYVLALRACTPAEDPVFAANVLAGMARQLLYLGHPSDAFELVRLAQDTAASRATPTVRSMLYTREAWGYARQGRVAAFWRATGKAEEALVDAAVDDDPEWIRYFDAAELSGTTGGRLLDLARQNRDLARESAGYISRAVTLRTPGRLRSSALDQLGLAEALPIQGELAEAARVGHQALAVAERTPSDRVRLKMATVYQRTAVHLRVPAVADIRDRMRSLLAASASGPH